MAGEQVKGTVLMKKKRENKKGENKKGKGRIEIHVKTRRPTDRGSLPRFI